MGASKKDGIYRPPKLAPVYNGLKLIFKTKLSNILNSANLDLMLLMTFKFNSKMTFYFIMVWIPNESLRTLLEANYL